MTGWLELYGDKVDTRSPDVKEILEAAGPRYIVEYKNGLAIILTPTGQSRFRRFSWFVSFNPPNLYFPDHWFHEASSEHGMVYNREKHGPRAVTMLADELRKVAADSEVRTTLP